MLRVRDLTPGERLLLERRRLGETKPAAADRYGVSLYRYGQWERDDPAARAVSDVPRPRGLLRLEFHEASFLLRRRAGVTVEAFAAAAGMSAWWLTRIERGQEKPALLAAFWLGAFGGIRSPKKLEAALARLAG